MSKSIAAWIHVTPSPTTLAESSAILRYLNQQSRVRTFIKRKDSVTSEGEQQSAGDENGSYYYAVFQRPLHDGYMNFSVPVYQDSEKPKDIDPYNVRGLRYRKPLPAKKVFNCVLRREENPDAQEWLQHTNPYNGPFRVDRQSPLRKILIDAGASKFLAARLKPLATAEYVEELELKKAKNEDFKRWEASKPETMPMDSLMKPWREAVGNRAVESTPSNTENNNGTNSTS